MDGVAMLATTEAMLEAATGAGGVLNGAEVVLWKNDIVPAVDTVLADLELATFDGYAASSAVTWSAALHESDAEFIVSGGDKVFICTGDTTPNLIYGWALTDGAGTNLLFAKRFDQPISVSEAGNFVSVHVELKMPSDSLN